MLEPKALVIEGFFITFIVLTKNVIIMDFEGLQASLYKIKQLYQDRIASGEDRTIILNDFMNDGITDMTDSLRLYTNSNKTEDNKKRALILFNEYKLSIESNIRYY